MNLIHHPVLWQASHLIQSFAIWIIFIKKPSIGAYMEMREDTNEKTLILYNNLHNILSSFV